MIIANPIYDTVFKYMMSDSKVAKTFLSAIIGEKVREEMQMEDDYLNELLMKDEIIAEKDKSLAEKDKSLAEKDMTIAEKDKIIAELKRRLIDKENDNK